MISTHGMIEVHKIYRFDNGYGASVVRSRCAWWCEDAQKCAVLVLAETQRKAVKK